MLGGADNPNGELLSYIIGADKSGCICGNPRPSERGAVNQHSIDSNGGKRGNLKIKPHTPQNFAGFMERDFFRSGFASSP